MNNSQLLIHVALFPFKDLEFYGQGEILRVAEGFTPEDDPARKAEYEAAKKRMVQRLHYNVLGNAHP